MENKIEIARRLRKFMEKMSDKMDDTEILEAPEVCRHWRPNEDVAPGDRRFYPPTKKLYKVKDGKGHRTQEDWTPDKTPDLWAVVALATELGTIESPIEAARGMDYTYGLYYLDPEDSNIYLCKRNGEEDGGVINLQHLPHELIEHYFVLAD